MNIVTTVDGIRTARQLMSDQTVGFVATMGHLHEGHLALCKRSMEENDITIVSIFVNPAQFNEQHDFDCYPKTKEQDIKMLSSLGVHYVFMPTAEQMYPDNYEINISESNISTEMEGEYRPGHFDGVLTVVLKLLNLTRPTNAYFGKKDYQQWLLIKKMVDALFMPINVIGCGIVRASDKLALSSRNSRLSEESRQLAAQFPAILTSAKNVDAACAKLSEIGFKVDYVKECWGRRFAAVWIDEVRLIDNVELAMKGDNHAVVS